MHKNACFPQLWITTIDDTYLTEANAIHSLSISEAHRLQKIKNSYKRREYLFSRALIKQALKHNFSDTYETFIFYENELGPPTIENLPLGFSTSLSHSKGTICFVIAKVPVGVDIERMRLDRNFIEASQIFMSTHELSVLKQRKTLEADYFYEVWCQKEAYFKLLTTQEQKSFDFQKKTIETVFENNKYSLFNKKYQHYNISVVFEGAYNRMVQYILTPTHNNFQYTKKTYRKEG